jgi:hypothetical protein
VKKFISIIAFVFLAALLTQGLDKKKPQQAFQIIPNQTADLNSGAVATAKQKCENWALAAGLETMLARQGVALDQSFWIMRLNHGELCVSPLPSMEKVAEVVNKEFVLDDGRHVQLEIHFTPGAPTNIDAVIAALKHQQVTVLIFRGHPYYLMGATYDEQIGREGLRRFLIKELRMANTFGGEPGVTFQRYREDTAEIDGVLSVSVAAAGR